MLRADRRVENHDCISRSGYCSMLICICILGFSNVSLCFQINLQINHLTLSKMLLWCFIKDLRHSGIATELLNCLVGGILVLSFHCFFWFLGNILFLFLVPVVHSRNSPKMCLIFRVFCIQKRNCLRSSDLQTTKFRLSGNPISFYVCFEWTASCWVKSFIIITHSLRQGCSCETKVSLRYCSWSSHEGGE
jgi:hypothetical protein